MNLGVWIKYAWATITFGKLILLRDSDGEVNLRIARKRRNLWTGEIEWRANRFGFGVRVVTLLPGGKLRNGVYVMEWKPFPGWLGEGLPK